MTKLFSWDARKGTLLDSVSSTKGTLTAGSGGFKKTEKGLALYGDGSATQIVTDSTLPFAYTDTFTFETTIKILDTNGGYIFSNATSGGFGLYVTSAMNYKMFNGVADTTSASTTLKIGKWYHIVGVYSNGTINYYLNNVADGTVSSGYSFAASTTKLTLLNRPGGSSGGTLFKGYLGIVRFYNTALTTKERNELYKEFLNSYGTEKPKRNFEYPKPTDLSSEVDSVVGDSFFDGSFDTDTTGDYIGVDTTISYENSSFMRATYTTSAANKGVVAPAVISGQKYLVTFKAKGTRAESFSSVINNGDVGEALSNPTLTTSWQEYRFIVTANSVTNRLYLDGGSIGDTLDLDDISMQPYSGLVAAYSFSPETVKGGVMTDISGNGNNGTINGALLTKDGMKFDGGGSVVIPYSSSLQMKSNDCTFNYRLKTGIISANQSVWDSREANDDGLNILIHSSGAIWVQINAIDTKTIGMVASNSEYAISIVIDRSSVVKISINGVEASYSQQPSINSQILNTSNDFSIGKNFLNTDNYQGEIQDLKIYNYAFTPAQAKDYHNSFVKPVLLEDFSNYPVAK